MNLSSDNITVSESSYIEYKFNLYNSSPPERKRENKNRTKWSHLQRWNLWNPLKVVLLSNVNHYYISPNIHAVTLLISLSIVELFCWFALLHLHPSIYTAAHVMIHTSVNWKYRSVTVYITVSVAVLRKIENLMKRVWTRRVKKKVKRTLELYRYGCAYHCAAGTGCSFVRSRIRLRERRVTIRAKEPTSERMGAAMGNTMEWNGMEWNGAE